MVSVKVTAWLGKQTLAVLADTVLKLFAARGMTEVCSRTSYIMDISFEIFFFCDKLCLSEKIIVASHLHDTALLERKSAEAASSKTASVADETETDF